MPQCKAPVGILYIGVAYQCCGDGVAPSVCVRQGREGRGKGARHRSEQRLCATLPKRSLFSYMISNFDIKLSNTYKKIEVNDSFHC